MTTQAKKFQGFATTTKSGKPCYVINEGTLADGTPAYKVQIGFKSNFHGWSGGARQTVNYTGQIGWIAKSKVN